LLYHCALLWLGLPGQRTGIMFFSCELTGIMVTCLGLQPQSTIVAVNRKL
jgi:hypothetical protein